jgi:hypothetical protein
MGTFLIGFGIVQTLQVLSKMPGKIPGLSSGSDHQGRSPEGGETEAVVAIEIVGVVTRGWPAHFDDPSLKNFLQEVIPSVRESAYRSK